jgi:hypothetical protein
MSPDPELKAADIEYRALLIELIKSHDTDLNIDATARLFWARLRLGLTLEQVRELENRVRQELRQYDAKS